jgi:hypothetical protein
MLREIVTPTTQSYTVQIPLEYLNKKVEILVLPVEEENTLHHETDIIRKTAGILSGSNIDPIAWQNEIRNEWE